jgi:hypothetical protein
MIDGERCVSLRRCERRGTSQAKDIAPVLRHDR